MDIAEADIPCFYQHLWCNCDPSLIALPDNICEQQKCCCFAHDHYSFE